MSKRIKNLTINSLGEVFLKDATVAGSVNLTELALKLGRTRTPTKAQIDADFQRQLRAGLDNDTEAVNFVNTVWKLQSLNDGRCRVWAGRGRICLCTEINELVANRKFWSEARKVARELGAEWWVMHEDERSDHCIYNSGKPNERHVYGPGHGKMERQVELSLTVTEPTLRAVRALKRKLEAATEPLWKLAGVGVM
jgi:hypothetical protein